MKRTSLNILGTITVLTMVIAFSGCESGNQQLPSQPANPQVQPPITTQQQAATPENTQDTELADQVAFDGARQLRDVTFCQKIVNAELKQSCVTLLNDTATQQAAVDSMNPTLCDKLSTKALQNGCRMRLEVEGKNSEIQNKFAEETKLWDAMNEKKDFSKCESLTYEPYKKDCIFVRTRNDAIAKKNPIICKELKDGDSISECEKQYFGSPDYFKDTVTEALNSKDISKCKQLKLLDNQKSCEEAYRQLTNEQPFASQQNATQITIVQ